MSVVWSTEIALSSRADALSPPREALNIPSNVAD